MRRSDLRRACNDILADITGVHADLDALLEALDRNCGIGYPTSTMGGGIRSGGTVSSITERQAFTHDQAAVDRRRLDELLAWAHGAMAEVDAIRRRNMAPPRKGTARRKGTMDDGCEMMALIDVYEQGRLTDVGGLLPHKRRLCRWAIDFVARNDRLPVREEVETHARGGRVRTG